MPKQEWIVKISVDDSWVEDGFELQEETLKGAIESMIPFGYSNETEVKILEAPNPETIRKLQGY